MRERTFRTALTMAGALSFMMVCVAGMAVAQPLVAAAAEPAGSSGSVAWAWGGVRAVAFSGAAGSYTYQGTAVFGVTVVVNQTNLSATTYSLNVTRTIGAILNVTFCAPNCRHPVGVATLAYHKWEVASVVSTLTTAGSVTGSSGSEAAIALNNSSGSVSAHVRESAMYRHLGVAELEHNLSANLSAKWELNLTPGLGLIPLNLSANSSWTSSSSYTLVGSAMWNYTEVIAGPLALEPVNVTVPGNATLNASGEVDLAGSYSGAGVTFGHVSYPAVNVTITSAEGFTLREGFLLLPAPADLFGTAAPAWSASETGSATATSSTVEVAAHLRSGDHLGFVASGLVFRSNASNLAAGSGGAVAAAAPAASGNSTFVQASPESVSQATSGGNCLSSGLGCPSVGAPPRGLLGAAIVIGAVAVASIVAVALVVDRRRLPPPPYPHASLYPPGAGFPGTAPSPPSPPPPAPDDDPLGHLW